jgi:hypothetical protein
VIRSGTSVSKYTSGFKTGRNQKNRLIFTRLHALQGDFLASGQGREAVDWFSVSYRDER